jgi:hypothetical protein
LKEAAKMERARCRVMMMALCLDEKTNGTQRRISGRNEKEKGSCLIKLEIPNIRVLIERKKQ